MALKSSSSLGKLKHSQDEFLERLTTFRAIDESMGNLQAEE